MLQFFVGKLLDVALQYECIDKFVWGEVFTDKKKMEMCLENTSHTNWHYDGGKVSLSSNDIDKGRIYFDSKFA